MLRSEVNLKVCIFNEKVHREFSFNLPKLESFSEQVKLKVVLEMPKPVDLMDGPGKGQPCFYDTRSKPPAIASVDPAVFTISGLSNKCRATNLPLLGKGSTNSCTEANLVHPPISLVYFVHSGCYIFQNNHRKSGFKL